MIIQPDSTVVSFINESFTEYKILPIYANWIQIFTSNASLQDSPDQDRVSNLLKSTYWYHITYN